MPVFTDQLNRIISLPGLPRRIISVVPSQTELLASLGLEEEVIGITRFCVRPSRWFQSKKRIGGTKDLQLETIRGLAPDLILAGKEENLQDQVEALAQDFPVWVSEVKNLGDACSMIGSVGLMTGREQTAIRIEKAILQGFDRLRIPANRMKAAYLIWNKPMMAAGGDSFIHDLLSRCGWENIFASKPRYPLTSPEELLEAGCQLLLLSSEPFPFSLVHQQQMEKLLPGVKVVLADGEFFSWYGSRLLEAPAYLEGLARSVAL